jgi:hypothetical protein
VELEAFRLIGASLDARVVLLVASQLALRRKSASFARWDISQAPKEQLCAHRAAQAMVQISLVKRNAPSAPLEGLRLEQEHLFVTLAIMDRTLKKARLSVVSAVQVHTQWNLRRLALCALPGNINLTLE